MIHLRVHSTYSLSLGAIMIDDLVKKCVRLDMPAVAITDSHNLFGALEFAETAKRHGIQPIIGVELNFAIILDGKRNLFKLPAIAKNKIGYQNLLQLVSNSYKERSESGEPFVSLDELEQFAEGLIILTGTKDGPLSWLIKQQQIDEMKKLLDRMEKIFPNHLYIELARPSDSTETTIIEEAMSRNLPLVATNDCYFLEKDEFEAQDVLSCIARGHFIADQDRQKISSPDGYLKTSAEMAELFVDIPEAIKNSYQIAMRVSYAPETRKPTFPLFPTSDGRSEEEELKVNATDGLATRLKHKFLIENITDKERQEKLHIEYQAKLDYELDVIIKMGFAGYFLIVSDFIGYAKTHNIPVGPGRGSGAGSLVAWAVNITNIDPLRFGLIFERFLNPERVSMPDFDIDFCQERRDEVIKYVQQRYGEKRVAGIITFGKLQARAALKDVGRVLGVPYKEVDRLCKMIPFNPIDPVTLAKAIAMDPQLQQAARAEETAKLIEIALKLEGLYRHASTHAAGIVIGDQDLDKIATLYYDGKSQMPAIGYSMKYAEAAGLVKFDFLGLKTLTVLSKASELIKKKIPEFNLDMIRLDDKKTFELLSSGNAVGVFQLESYGMRDALTKLRPDKIEDIIALGALYRPGPMDSIPNYIARKHGTEKVVYPHPFLEEALKETFGVIVYQEQVMQIAQLLAGYSLGAADLLRRAMGKKIKSEMDDQQKIFVDGAMARGLVRHKAEQIFELMAKFSGYGFNKGHSAPYGLIAYQTAYLKANFPAEFLTASFNLDIDDSDKINIFRQQAVNMGIALLPPDINKSDSLFTLDGEAIRYGLGGIKAVSIGAINEIMKIRSGGFASFDHFVKFAAEKLVNKKQIEALAAAGAFDCLDQNRRKFYDYAELIMRRAMSYKDERNNPQMSLFGSDEQNDLHLPSPVPWDEDEKLAAEFLAFGFFLSSHPLEKYHQILIQKNVTPIKDIEHVANSSKRSGITVAGVVTGSKHRFSNKKRFSYLYISDPSGIFEVSIFSDKILDNSRELMEAGTKIVIDCSVKRDDGGGFRIIAENLTEIEKFLQERANDFIYLSEPVTYSNYKKDYTPTATKGRQISAFSKPIETTTHRKILRIKVNSSKPLKAINDWYSMLPIGFTRIELVIDNESAATTLSLPRTLLIESQDIENLTQIEGVVLL